MKDYLEVNTKTIVATGLGAAIFMLLFMYVKVPSPIPETSFQTAYGVSAFFAALFGPIAGALIAFIGHALSDAVQYGSPWWSWVIASGVSGLVFGFSYKRTKVEDGEFAVKDIITFNVIQIIGNAIAWVVVAPVLDILIYQEPANKVFTQGITAAIMNAISAGVIGTLQATEAIKHLLAAGKPLTNRLLVYNALTAVFRTVATTRNPDCPLCGYSRASRSYCIRAPARSWRPWRNCATIAIASSARGEKGYSTLSRT